jgi:hypothetical protein
MRQKRPLSAIAVGLALVTLTGCTALGIASPTDSVHISYSPAAPTPSEILQLPIFAKPAGEPHLSKRSNLVIANIGGPCSDSVRIALMRRFTDNPNHNVITRQYLDQLVQEKEEQYTGDYDTETAAKLGRLLGASQWIVGEVVYCHITPIQDPTSPGAVQVKILAALQILDLATGKILASSVSEGIHIPRETSQLDFFVRTPELDLPETDSDEAPAGGEGVQAAREQDPDSPVTAEPPVATAFLQQNNAPLPSAGDGWFQSFVGGVRQRVLPGRGSGSAGSRGGPRGSGKEQFKKESEPQERAKLAAADNLADNFADKIFARPLWETVEMWKNPTRLYTEAIRFAQLGRCDLAIDFMDRVAKDELASLDEHEISEYLHNYGVALLCANRLDEAVAKLSAAYRITSSESTLKMMGLAAKLAEWSLTVQPETQPEIQILAGRSASPYWGRLIPEASSDAPSESTPQDD